MLGAQLYLIEGFQLCCSTVGQYTSVTFRFIWHLLHCSKHAGIVIHCAIVMVSPLTGFHHRQHKADLARTACPTFIQPINR